MVLNLKTTMQIFYSKLMMKMIIYIYENEDNMFEYDKEDGGMIIDENLNAFSQRISSYFKSSSDFF